MDEAGRRIFVTLARCGGLILMLLAVMVTADVTVRAATGRPFTGVFELTRLFLLIAVCLALAPVQYFDAHLRVDILSVRFKGAARTLSTMLDRILTLVAFGMIGWVAAKEGFRAFSGGFLQPGIIQIPSYIPLAFVLFGTVSVCITVLFTVLLHRRRN